MKLVRRLAALPLLLSFTVGLFALQFGGYRRQRYNDGPNVPSEFYWTRLMYTSAGGRGGFRFFGRIERGYVIVGFNRVNHLFLLLYPSSAAVITFITPVRNTRKGIVQNSCRPGKHDRNRTEGLIPAGVTQ